MLLTDSLVPSYVGLVYPRLTPAEREERARALAAQLGAGPLAAPSVLAGPGGAVYAAAILEPDAPPALHVVGPLFDPAALAGREAELIGLIDEVKARAFAAGAGHLDLRLAASDATAPLRAALPGLGFAMRHVRVEYKTPLSELPEEGPSPLSWEAMAPRGRLTLPRVAELLRAAGEGDPDFDPAEDAAAVIGSYLADPVLTSGPGCVHVGYVDGEPAAIVVAQIDPRTRWSRISYMGLAPRYRGRGLGRHVHRHGLAMLRAQGGELYHGGTVETNRAMVRLFEAHGCRFFRRLEAWRAGRAG